MAILDVHNSILDTFQRNATIDSLFSTVLTGTAGSNGTAVLGVDTLFTTELAVGDYIGNPTKGYRKITAIADNTHLTVKSAYDIDMSAESIKKTEIKKGVPDDLNISTVGRCLRVAFISSVASGFDVSSARVKVHYGFLIIMGFKESDVDEAEDKKSTFEKSLGDCIDNNPTFGLIRVEGTTELGQMKYASNPEVDGEWLGAASLVVTRQELRGNR